MPKNTDFIQKNAPKTEYLEAKFEEGIEYTEKEIESKTFYGRVHGFLGKNNNCTIYDKVFPITTGKNENAPKEFSRRVQRFPYGENRTIMKQFTRPEFSFVIGVAFALCLSISDANKLLDSANLGQLHPWRTDLPTRGDPIVLKYYNSIVEKLSNADNRIQKEGKKLIKQMNQELVNNNYKEIMWNMRDMDEDKI